MKCKLCKGTGDNRTGVVMSVNNHICPRCGGYGTVPVGTPRAENRRTITDEDRGYMRNNGAVFPSDEVQSTLAG